MDERKCSLSFGVIGFFIGILLILIITPVGVMVYNNYKFEMQTADDESNYKTKKKVEDTCRSMISSYESDKMIYELYKDSDREEKREWAEQAKIRANKTATSYNNYILKNSFVWKSNVPEDISEKLDIIK